MSQRELGEALGASTRTIEEWEAGWMPAKPMLRLAFAALEVGSAPWSAAQTQKERRQP